MKTLIEEMTREEAQEAFASDALVVLPTGSTEQHGPHLPLMVDALAATYIAREAAMRVQGRVPVVVAPTMHYGVSHHHLAFAGTMSLTAHLYVESIKELIRCVHRHGVRRVVLINGHGGNGSPNGVIAHGLVHEEGLDLSIGQASYWTIASKALTEAGANDVGPRFPGHAGGFETSLTLALRPDLVQLSKRPSHVGARQPDAATPGRGSAARLVGGVSDDASRADAEIGKRLVEAAVTAVAEYYVDFYQRTTRQA